MKLIYAKNIKESKRDAFFAANKHLNNDQLLADGYMVEHNDEIIGCFIIEPVSVDICWLKQLYIIQSSAHLLPALLEAILMFAKRKQVKKVHVYSHQPTVDIILAALQFQVERKAEPITVNTDHYNNGKWWTYSVS